MLTLPATPRVRYTLRNDDFHSITECLSGQIIWEVSLGFLLIIFRISFSPAVGLGGECLSSIETLTGVCNRKLLRRFKNFGGCTVLCGVEKNDMHSTVLMSRSISESPERQTFFLYA